MADGLLDVDVFPCLTGPDRHDRVPMVRRRDRDRVDVAIVEHTPEVGFRPGVPSPFLPGERQRRVEMPLVDVDDVRDAHVPDVRQMFVVIESAAAGGPGRVASVVATQTDDGDIDRVVRASLRVGPRRAHRQSNGRGGGFREEDASVHHGRPRQAERVNR